MTFLSINDERLAINEIVFIIEFFPDKVNSMRQKTKQGLPIYGRPCSRFSYPIFSCRRNLSEIMAINSLLVGLPLSF